MEKSTGSQRMKIHRTRQYMDGQHGDDGDNQRN